MIKPHIHLPPIHGSVVHDTGEIYLDFSMQRQLADYGGGEPAEIGKMAIQETIDGRFNFAQIGPVGIARVGHKWPESKYPRMKPDEFAERLAGDLDYQLFGLMPGVFRINPHYIDGNHYVGVLYIWQEDGIIQSRLRF